MKTFFVFFLFFKLLFCFLINDSSHKIVSMIKRMRSCFKLGNRHLRLQKQDPGSVRELEFSVVALWKCCLLCLWPTLLISKTGLSTILLSNDTGVAVLILPFILKSKNLETLGQVLLGSTQVRWSTSFLRYIQAFFLSQHGHACEHLPLIFRRTNLCHLERGLCERRIKQIFVSLYWVYIARKSSM